MISHVVREIGGQELKLMPGEFCGFNFADIEPDAFDKQNHLLAKIEEVKSVILGMVERDGQHPLTPEEEALLEVAIREDYMGPHRGITEDPNSLYEKDPREGAVGFRKKEMPTITSIANMLDKIGKEKAERIVTRLIPYRREGAMGMFDGQTTVDLKGLPAVNFNLKALDALPKLKLLALPIIQNFTWEYFVKQDLDDQKRVLADEFWLFEKIRSSLLFFEQLARRAAKRNTTMTIATQNFRELSQSPEAKVILSQAGVTLLFQQHPSDLASLQELFDLPDGQVDFIRRLHPGDCLMRMGDLATAMHVEVMEYEEPFVFTTAGQWGVASETEEFDDEEQANEEVPV